MVAEPDNLSPEPPEPADDDDGDEPLESERGRGMLVSGLSSSQEAAIVALLDQPSIPLAAKAAGVGVRTLTRWLSEPVFQKAFRRARREAFSHAISLAQRYAPLAMNVLAKVMSDAATPAHAKVSAATALLKFGREGIEMDDLAARVEALEEAAAIEKNSSSSRRWRA